LGHQPRLEDRSITQKATDADGLKRAGTALYRYNQLAMTIGLLIVRTMRTAITSHTIPRRFVNLGNSGSGSDDFHRRRPRATSFMLVEWMASSPVHAKDGK
jgi:hypothetical protein